MNSNPDILEPIYPQIGPQYDFLVSQADITIYGGKAGGGKTWGMLMAPLNNIDDQNFNGIYFRRTYPELIAGGGIWDTSKKIFTRFNARPNESKLLQEFPSGAKIKFSHLQYDSDVNKHQSAAYALVAFDELPQFSMYQFFYLLSRNRAPTGYNKSCWCIAAGNAEPGWVADLIAWWWDPETGYAIPERSGIVRYFTRDCDVIKWVGKDWRDERGNKPTSITFIAAGIDDNPILKKNDPKYESNLMAQDFVTRERLLKGNWKVTYAGGMFNPDWFIKIPIEKLPPDLKKVRYWDFAASEVKEGKDPDYTSGCLLGTDERDYYIIDVKRFREAPGKTQKIMEEVALSDGMDTIIAWEEEKGSAGKFNSFNLTGKFLGYITKPDPVVGDKIERAKPVAAAAEHGHVYIVAGAWNNPFLAEIGQFGSGRGYKDQADSLSGASKLLSTSKIIWGSFTISQTKNIMIDWTNYSEYQTVYTSYFLTRSSALYVLSGIWDSVEGKLFIFWANKYDTIMPELIAADAIKANRMRKILNANILGNEALVSTDGTKTTGYLLGRTFKSQGVTWNPRFPMVYELYGAIAYAGALFATECIMVHKGLIEPAAQFAGWNYKDKDKAPADGFEYCHCLCLMVADLKRKLEKDYQPPKISDYSPTEKKKEGKQSWQTV